MTDPFGFTEDIVGGLTGQTGAEAAERAAATQAGASIRAAEIGAESQERALQAMLEQLGITREAFAPFLEAGTGALPTVQRGATVGGLEETLAQIMGGEAFQPLVEERERSVRGQLAAGGLTRSGAALEEIAGVPTDLAFQIENLLSGRQRDIAGMGLSAAAQSAGAEGGLSTQLANILTGIGQTQAGGVLGAAQATASGILGGAQAEQQGLQNLLNIGGTLAMAFSDPRLKENILIIGKAGPLDVVTWDWKPEFEGTIVNNFDTVGFLSTQVREHYPHHVTEVGGFDVIDYPALHEELKWH
jgi:hypothetical protein